MHQKSLVITFRRYVVNGHDKALAGLISTPRWIPKPQDQITRCRHFVCSRRFEREFPTVRPDELLQTVDKFTRPRKGGIVGEFAVSLGNVTGPTTIHPSPIGAGRRLESVVLRQGTGSPLSSSTFI